MKQILDFFSNKQIDNSWSFSDKTRKETTYVTHGYHRYPAKFIPQLAAKLIEEYADEGDLVVDPFSGCGTTLIESKLAKRPAVGVDVNPVAVLISRAKIQPIVPLLLEDEFSLLRSKLELYDKGTELNVPKHERIDYWFKPDEKRELAYIFNEISNHKNTQVKNFFYCAFSNILKNCSIWLQKSNKPTRDFNKKLPNPSSAFLKQVRMMIKGNNSLYQLLKSRENLETTSQIYCEDARNIPVADGAAGLVVTSPPYVTSYEYADLHQLTALWFNFMTDLNSFRKQFIGTTSYEKKPILLNSKIAESIKEALFKKDKKISEEVATYFSEMNQVFIELKRILKEKGKACIVIGNTRLKGVDILNAEVFSEQMKNIGLNLLRVIKREIPSKNLPSIRDQKTGKFAKLTDTVKVQAYPTEYILVVEKQRNDYK